MFAQTQEENPEVYERHILGQTPAGPSSLGGQQDGQPSPEPLQGRSGRQVGEPDPIIPFPLVDTPRTLALCHPPTVRPTLPFAGLTPSKPRVFGGLPRLWVPALLQAGKPWAEQASLSVFGRRLPPTLARAERPCCTAALPAAAALNPVLLPHKRLICYIFSDAVNGRTKTFSLSYFCSIMFVGEPDPLQRGAREVEEASQAC